MLGSFSFGKIMKTFLPGAVLAAALLLFFESIGWCAYGRSMLWFLSDNDRLAALLAVLLPLCLIFGFLLNTMIWAWVNPAMKTAARAEADKKFQGLREHLRQLRGQELQGLLGPKSGPETWPREALEYYFLCSVEVEPLAHLWESYFSWYEFHINSAYAIPVLALSAGWYAALGLQGVGPFSGNDALAIGVIVAFVVIGMASFSGLRWTAQRNLVQYEKSLLLLIAGSLRERVPG